MIQTPARNLLYKLGINETWGMHTVVLMREHGCEVHIQKEEFQASYSSSVLTSMIQVTPESITTLFK